MKKIEAVKHFGSVAELAQVLDISVQAIYQWPEELSRKISDQIELAIMKEKSYSKRTSTSKVK
jgi:DNA-binding XRE family transcriptional regulator